MNKLTLKTIFDFYNSTIFKYLLLYLTIGLWISFSMIHSNYIDSLIEVFMNKYFLSFFVIPSVLIINLMLIVGIRNNYSIMLRLTKHNQLFLIVKFIFFNTFCLLIAILLLMLLFANLFSSKDNIINFAYYGGCNLLMLVIKYIEIYMYLVFLSLCSALIMLSRYICEKIFTICLLIIILVSSFITSYTPFSFLFPSYYIFNLGLFPNLYLKGLISILYFITINLFELIMIKVSIYKNE